MSLLMGPEGPIVLMPATELHPSLAELRLSSIRYVPDHPEDLNSFVRMDPAPQQAHVRSFPFNVNFHTGEKMVVRIQGVISDLILNKRGDGGVRRDGQVGWWDPLMYLRLVSGYKDWDRPFRLQMEILATLINTIMLKLDLEPFCTTQNLPKDLVMRRRVYASGDDAGPTLEYLTMGGIMKKARRSDFQSGDLVDVSVEFDFVVHKSGDGIPRTSVFLTFNRIVRLRRCIELQLEGGMGIFRPPLVLDRYDYVDTGNIGYQVPIHVDAGNSSPDADELHIATNGNTNPSLLPSNLIASANLPPVAASTIPANTPAATNLSNAASSANPTAVTGSAIPTTISASANTSHAPADTSEGEDSDVADADDAQDLGEEGEQIGDDGSELDGDDDPEADDDEYEYDGWLVRDSEVESDNSE